MPIGGLFHLSVFVVVLTFIFLVYVVLFGVQQSIVPF